MKVYVVTRVKFVILSKWWRQTKISPDSVSNISDYFYISWWRKKRENTRLRECAPLNKERRQWVCIVKNRVGAVVTVCLLTLGCYCDLPNCYLLLCQLPACLAPQAALPPPYLGGEWHCWQLSFGRFSDPCDLPSSLIAIYYWFFSNFVINLPLFLFGI